MSVKYIFLDEVNSTQTYAKKNINSFDPNKITVIAAEKQTQGKGRFNRNWISSEGNLYVTYYFQLNKKNLHLTSISHILAISVVEVLRNEDLNPKIKWPNDIMLSNKKLSGILSELVMKGDKIETFLGIGINVNIDQKKLAEIDKPATSLKAETNKTWDIKNLLEKLTDKFIKNLKIFQEKGFTPFHSEFENLLLYKGKNITFFDGKKEYNGCLHSINCRGELNLYMPNKEIITFTAGDIIEK